MTESKNVTNFRQRRKALLVRISGGACSLCGYDKCIGALEFHHINPEDKEYQLSSGNCHSLEQDINELKKCLLVCANCHREIHQEDSPYTQEELFSKQIFIEEELEKEQNHKYYCIDCGKEVSSNKHQRCLACHKEYIKSKVKPPREELKKLIRDLPFTKIGEMFGVSNNAVVKWCKKEDLPFRKRDIVQYSDEDWAKI